MTLAAQMARTVTIDIAKDFSAEPFGRYAAHGPASGEVFRARLERYIRDGSHVLVDIDGVTGLSSSFLDEAFAGLVRHGCSRQLTFGMSFRSSPSGTQAILTTLKYMSARRPRIEQ
uniref:STAS-like domain-containing protein n=1 Tax=Phenylobacterium glaciei TaxID=2803784 RepID=A0A974S7S4_9CAUL|nr:STAS-like domain-containing protein [Phenylobacterium glaciei]